MPWTTEQKQRLAELRKRYAEMQPSEQEDSVFKKIVLPQAKKWVNENSAEMEGLVMRAKLRPPDEPDWYEDEENTILRPPEDILADYEAMFADGNPSYDLIISGECQYGQERFGRAHEVRNILEMADRMQEVTTMILRQLIFELKKAQAKP